jgi:hypothetical protein
MAMGSKVATLPCSLIFGLLFPIRLAPAVNGNPSGATGEGYRNGPLNRFLIYEA